MNKEGIRIDISIKKLCLVFIRLDSIATSKSRKSIFFIIINYSFDIKLNIIFLLTNWICFFILIKYT